MGTLISRTVTLQRATRETSIDLTLNLDGTGKSEICSGLGFFDHMLTLFAAHSLVDLNVVAKGDLHIDGHHTIEDIGIVLGSAFRDALGDKTGIARYGHFTLPMDEALATIAIDFGGRPHFVWRVEFPSPTIGSFDVELVREFWQAFAMAAQANLHCQCSYGTNCHHISEAIFKCTARAIRIATERDPRRTDIPSTKGTIGEQKGGIR